LDKRSQIVGEIAKELSRVGADWIQLFYHYKKRGLSKCSNQELENILNDLKKARASSRKQGRPPIDRLKKIYGERRQE